jgi:hypothetical protein
MKLASPRKSAKLDPTRQLIEDLWYRSSSPIDLRDLGKGARLLVPQGCGFGVPQLVRHGIFWDWVRKAPDHYWVAGDRGSTHGGVDLGFYVQRGKVYQLPDGLPIRAVADGVVQWVGKRTDPESELGVVVNHGPGDPKSGVFFYTHHADIEQAVKTGQRVKQGQVIGLARPFSKEFPVVVAHTGFGMWLPGWGNECLDPTAWLARWGVLHPVGPDSTCFADDLNLAKHGVWRAPGKIDGLEPVAKLDRRWKSFYR